MDIGGWRDARSHEVSVFLCPSPASQTCSFLGDCFLSRPTLFSWEQSPSQLRGVRTHLPCLALPSNRWDQPPPSQQAFGIGSRLTSLQMKTWPRTERETNAEDVFEEFQGAAESRPGAEGRGGLGVHWGWEPVWHVGGCSSTWDHPTGRPEVVYALRGEKIPGTVEITGRK